MRARRSQALVTLLTAVVMLGCASAARAQVFWNPVPRGLIVDLQAARADALEREDTNALPATSMYTAAPGPVAPPGTLIRSEPWAEYRLPAGVTAVRFVYWTVSPSGQPIAASGAVLVPPGDPPKSGWPVIAWAHGTSGASQQCAPSLMRDMQYGWIELSNLLDSGYAVIAPDYQGLGMPGLHPYMDPITNGQDVIHAVRAARVAVPRLGRRWVALGHSQGGLAVSAVAQLQRQNRDAGYLGGVAVGGGWDMMSLLRAWDSPSADPMLHGFMALLATGIRAVDSSFTADQLLAAPALTRVAGVTGHCDSVHIGALYDLTHENVFRPDWQQGPALIRWLDRARLDGPVDQPLLVIASTDDPIVPAHAVDGMVRRLCARGAPVDYRRFQGIGLDHSGILVATTGLRLRWIADRFAGRPAARHCPALSP